MKFIIIMGVASSIYILIMDNMGFRGDGCIHRVRYCLGYMIDMPITIAMRDRLAI